MNDQQKLMRHLNAQRFSAWELHLFLDSHPNNCEAAKHLEECRQIIAELTAQYEAAYGPLNELSSHTSRWAWVSGPWPWETEEEAD